MTWVITILALVVIFLSQKFYEYHKSNRLFENVKWCVSYDPYSSFDVRPELKQRGYIMHLQTESSIEEKYRIVESDFDGVNEILKSYQQDLLQRYFRGYAPAYRKLSEEEYFIVTLWDFLQSHHSEDSFTDYTDTYHKLSYIVRLLTQNIYKKGR